jgi:hypothetical protein
VQLGRLRKIVVFDRFLARLVHVRDDWVLKGGFALELRLGPRARTTRDVDIDRSGDPDDIVEAMRDAARTDLEDFFEFEIEKVADAVDGGRSLRFRASATVAGRQFDVVLVDVGTTDPLPTYVETLETPALLEFAGISPARVPSVPLDQHLAEKVHALTRTYGISSSVSSRVKDLMDIVLISEIGRLESDRARTALEATFERRRTHELPLELPSEQQAWRAQFTRIAADVGYDGSIADALARARAFVEPLLCNDVAGRRWVPEQAAWQ